jgi:hypothetical protein
VNKDVSQRMISWLSVWHVGHCVGALIDQNLIWRLTEPERPVPR